MNTKSTGRGGPWSSRANKRLLYEENGRSKPLPYRVGVRFCGKNGEFARCLLMGRRGRRPLPILNRLYILIGAVCVFH